MTDRIITAKAVISAEDQTGAAFDRIAKKLANLGKNAKISAEVDRMAKSLGRAETQMKAIDQHRATRNGFYTAKNQLDAARKAADQAAQALAGASKPTRALEADAARTAKALDAASKAFERQKTAVFATRRALTEGGVAGNKLISEQERLKTAVDATSKAIEKQVRLEQRAAEVGNVTRGRRVAASAERAAAADRLAERVQARRDAWKGAAGIVGLGAVHKAEHFGSDALHVYREFDKERRFGKVVMGLTDDEQKPLVDQAIHLGATTKFNDVQVLEAQRELAARGLKKDQVLGLIKPASDLGQALDLHLPDAVKQMEGAIFGFKKDISTLAAAKASAAQTADVQVKAAKISGMTPEDITQAYKYGATPARMSGLSEEMLLGFAAISKKANMGGDESGVAFRALVAAGQSPTRKAKEALLANGLNYKNYQRNPDSLALDPFVQNVAAQYGVKLNGKARSALGAIFSDKSLINDPAKFTPAVTSVLSSTLGGDDAKSKKSIAGAANRFRDASMQGVDMNKLVVDLMSKLPGNLQLANAVFGSKQGARIASALGDPETFKHLIDELKNHSEGFAPKVADERMAGFDGAVARFDGAVMNLKTALGRSLDSGGSGGPLTAVTNFGGWLAESLAELPSAAHKAGVALGTIGSLFVGAKSLGLIMNGFGLGTSAAALTGSAEALTLAAGRLGVAGAGGAATDLIKKGAPAAAAGIGLTGGLIAGAVVIAATGAVTIASEQIPKIVAEKGLGAIDPATGGVVDDNPMGGLDLGGSAPGLRRMLRRMFGLPAELPTKEETGWFDANGNLGERGAIGAPGVGLQGIPAPNIPLPPVRSADLEGKISATVEQPIPIAATPLKVEFSPIQTNVVVKVDGPGQVVNQSTTGSVARSTGESMLSSGIVAGGT